MIQGKALSPSLVNIRFREGRPTSWSYRTRLTEWKSRLSQLRIPVDEQTGMTKSPKDVKGDDSPEET